MKEEKKNRFDLTSEAQEEKEILPNRVERRCPVEGGGRLGDGTAHRGPLLERQPSWCAIS